MIRVTEMSTSAASTPNDASAAEPLVFRILVAVALGHGLHDILQAVLPSVYPLLKDTYQLSFSQIGLLTLAFQLTASILQPLIGLWLDKHPQPYALPVGMTLSLCGLVLLSTAHSFGWLVVAALFIGTGSSVFHPEASRVARLASGGNTALPNPSSNWGEISAPLSARSWRRSLSAPAGKDASCGLPEWRAWRSCSCAT